MNGTQNLRILVIDDNPAIHQDFLKILGREELLEEGLNKFTAIEEELFGKEKKEHVLPKFQIDTASQGKEGVEKVEEALKAGKPYALAFVDVRMPPGWDGIETIQRIWKLDNSVQMVICTAYSDYSWEETIQELGKTDNLLIIRKPFDNIAVRQIAFALTKKWYLLQQAQQYTYSLEEKVLKRTEALQKSFSLVRATLDSSSEGMIVIDNQQKISDFNNKFLEMWGISREELLNFEDSKEMMSIIVSQSKNSSEFLAKTKKLESKTNQILDGNIELKDKRVYEYHTQPYTLNEEIIGRVWSFRDVSVRASLQQELQFQATHDDLTKLPNRILLMDFMNQAILKADRNKSIFAILFLDLDRFKLINDSLSHAAGDEILFAVAQRLQRDIRKNDIFARLGGDEFVIVAEDIKEQTDIIHMAQQILASFTKPFIISERELFLTTSIGICFYPTDGNTIDLLLRNADSAMYQAKELGANQYQFYTEGLNRLNLFRLETETEIRSGLLKNEFFLCYQPQYNLTSKKLVSLEALIRWNHPQRGVLKAEEFVPLAVNTGLIVSLDEWVLRSVCKQIRAWKDEGLPFVRVAVNVTTKQFKAYNFPQLVKTIIDESKIPAKYLEFELSESIIINNPEMIAAIKALNSIGVQIALDDFGTGYSALSYLRQIPLHRLKIDQSFIQGIGASADDEVIIKAIIAIAKGLNLNIVAEGVETQYQLDFLAKEKCEEVQGYYFNKPLEIDACSELLKKLKL
jgi:diguanylate cyclase (GGDEF)-like protein/PAS domain S-box-containing protein